MSGDLARRFLVSRGFNQSQRGSEPIVYQKSVTGGFITAAVNLHSVSFVADRYPTGPLEALRIDFDVPYAGIASQEDLRVMAQRELRERDKTARWEHRDFLRDVGSAVGVKVYPF